MNLTPSCPSPSGSSRGGQYEGVFRSGIEPRFAAELLFDRILSLVTYGTWPDDSDEVTIADKIVEQYRKFFDQVLST